MYYFGNSIAIKDKYFMLYALNANSFMHTHVFLSQNLGSHILIYWQGNSVFCPIYTY